MVEVGLEQYFHGRDISKKTIKIMSQLFDVVYSNLV